MNNQTLFTPDPLGSRTLSKRAVIALSVSPTLNER